MSVHVGYTVTDNTVPQGDSGPSTLRLTQSYTPTKSLQIRALWPVHPGAVVRLVRDEAYYSIAHLRAFRDALWDTRGTDQPAPTIEVHPPGWRIEVDGETVLRVPDETKPVPPRPAIPWRTRAQWRLRKWFYAAIDRVVVPLGYHHEDDCGDYR